MEVKMTEQIQSIIIATQAYKEWICAHKQATNTWDSRWDWWQETYKYYVSILPKDCGLRSSRFCFDAVLSYPIKQTTSTEMEDLGKFIFKY